VTSTKSSSATKSPQLRFGCRSIQQFSGFHAEKLDRAS
jgi:hypothetical protein